MEFISSQNATNVIAELKKADGTIFPLVFCVQFEIAVIDLKKLHKPGYFETELKLRTLSTAFQKLAAKGPSIGLS